MTTWGPLRQRQVKATVMNMLPYQAASPLAVILLEVPGHMTSQKKGKT